MGELSAHEWKALATHRYEQGWPTYRGFDVRDTALTSDLIATSDMLVMRAQNLGIKLDPDGDDMKKLQTLMFNCGRDNLLYGECEYHLSDTSSPTRERRNRKSVTELESFYKEKGCFSNDQELAAAIKEDLEQLWRIRLKVSPLNSQGYILPG